MSAQVFINRIINDIEIEIAKVIPSDSVLDSLVKQLVEFGIYPNIKNINDIVKTHGPYWFLIPGLVITKNGVSRSMITYSQ